MPTKKEIAAAESKVDKAWEATALPKAELDHCLYQVLTHSEDWQRMAIASPDPNAYFAIHDGIKYALRRALLLIHEKASVSAGPPFQVDWTAYKAAHSFLEAADDYESATLAFALFWAGEAECKTANAVLAFRPPKPVLRHEALDLVIAEDLGLGPLETILSWLAGSKTRPAAVRSITRTVVFGAPNRISYSVVPKLADQIGRKLPRGKQLIPDAWRAWNIPSASTRKVLQAFRTRCAYHLIAVYRGASKFDIKGGAVDDLLLVCDRSELLADVTSISSEDDSVVKAILNALTYGMGTTTPDPALQPIIPLGATQLAIPCQVVLTSSLQRNLLSLQARVRPSEFHGQSKAFEVRMLKEICKILRRSQLVWEASVSSTAGEVDLLLGQVGSNLLLLLELKWFIPAGDRDEVLNRHKAVKHGAEQVKLKRDAVLGDLKRYQEVLGLHSPVGVVVGAVVCDGFTHPASEPCVPFSIVKKLLRQQNPIADLADVLQRQPWLPLEGDHFDVVETPHEVGGVKFSWIGHSPTPEGALLGMSWSGK